MSERTLLLIAVAVAAAIVALMVAGALVWRARAARSRLDDVSHRLPGQGAEWGPSPTQEHWNSVVPRVSERAAVHNRGDGEPRRQSFDLAMLRDVTVTAKTPGLTQDQQKAIETDELLNPVDREWDLGPTHHRELSNGTCAVLVLRNASTWNSQELVDLIAAGNGVLSTLRDVTPGVSVELAWPSEVVVSNSNQFVAYFTAPFGEAFTRMERGAPHPRTLGWVVERGSPTQAQRLELALSLAAWVRVMHENGIVHGSLTPDRIVCSAPDAGPVAMRVLDHWSTRQLGRSSWHGLDVGESSLASDRRALASSIVGLLVPRSGLSDWTLGAPGAIPGTSHAQARVVSLARRAGAGAAGAPTAVEWERALAALTAAVPAVR